MISMKVQKKESKQSGNPARSLILVTVCTCTAIAFAAGMVNLDAKDTIHLGRSNWLEVLQKDIRMIKISKMQWNL